MLRRLHEEFRGNEPSSPVYGVGARLRPSEDACVLQQIWVQHIPRARQHQVTYAGHFANALGNLNPKHESQVEESAEKPKSGKWSSGEP